MYKYFISLPPKKQAAIPAAIKIIATKTGYEFKYWTKPEGFTVPQPALWKAMNSRVHFSEFLAKENFS